MKVAWAKDILDTARAAPVLFAAFRQERRQGDWYQAPVAGWTCFHCDATFTNTGAAAVHFGMRPSEPVGCDVDIGEYRRMRYALHEAIVRLARVGSPATEEELYTEHVWGEVG